MSNTYIDGDGLVHFRDDTRDTIVKSAVSGVAATVLAVVIWSPAGLGGMIGTSVASNPDTDAAMADAVARLSPYPTPITPEELTQIHATLDLTESSLVTMRAATDGAISNIRHLASQADIPGASQMAAVSPVFPELRPTLDVDVAETSAPPVRADAQLLATSYSPPAPGTIAESHLEFAELLLSHR